MVLAALTVVLAFTVGSLVQWHQGHVKGAVAAALVVVALAGAIAVAHWRGSGSGVGGAGCAALAVRRGGRGPRRRATREQRHYLSTGFEDTGAGPGPRRCDPLGARRARRADRGRRHPRGVHAVPVLRRATSPTACSGWAIRGAHDSYSRIPDCRRVAPGGQRRRLHPRRHHLRPLSSPGRCATPRRAAGRSRTRTPTWSSSDGPVRVFQITGPLDPAGCKGQKPLELRPAPQRPEPQRDVDQLA